MRKRKIVNLCMVFAIAIVVLGGIFAVGAIKGWFRNEATSVVVLEKTGIVMLERSGVSYEVETESALRKKDCVTTVTASELVIGYEQVPGLYVDSDSTISMDDIGESLVVTLAQGDVVFDGRNWPNTKIQLSNVEVSVENAVIAVSVKPGADMVYVFYGDVRVCGFEDSDAQTLTKGQMLTAIAGNETWSVEDLAAQNVKDFVLETIINCGLDETFYFTEAELQGVLTERMAQKLAGEALPEGESFKYCTLEIRCDTILDNMDKLSKGKEGYVPDAGVILEQISVAYVDGETVFDVLERVCTSADIPLEYAYTPIYESYYVEGIGHLYEFDCGHESGWMFQVNGWFPNYGSSSYKVEEGDAIVWCYTCTGLGTDVGSQRMD